MGVAKVATGAAGESAEALAKKGAKSFTSTYADDLLKKLSKEAAADAATGVGKKVPGSTLDTLKKSLTKNLTPKNLALLGAAGAGAYGISTVINKAEVAAKEKNSTPLTITSISNDSNSKNLNVKFDNPKNLELIKTDELTITGSNSVPSVDDTYTKPKIVSRTEVVLTSDKKLTQNGTTGTMTIKTSTAEELGHDLNPGIPNPFDAFKNAWNAAKDALSGALGSTGKYVLYGLVGIVGIVALLFLIFVLRHIPWKRLFSSPQQSGPTRPRRSRPIFRPFRYR